MERSLNPGDRVWISGGYDMEPRWLGGGSGYAGVVSGFISGQNKKSAMVVMLDAVIKVDGAEGRHLVLELRYVGAEWREGVTVHLELLRDPPEGNGPHDRPRGAWIESHAMVRLA